MILLRFMRLKTRMLKKKDGVRMVMMKNIVV